MNDTVNIAMHPALVDAFKEWLATRELELMKIPTGVLTEEWWIVTPTEDKWDRLVAQAKRDGKDISDKDFEAETCL